MLEILRDIDTAAKAGAYRAALALALTVPDICGQIAYPEMESVGARYRRWFNQYVKQHYKQSPLINSLGVKLFDAHACYCLRCAFLHTGNSAVNLSYIKKLDFFAHRDNDLFFDDRIQFQFDTETNESSDVLIQLNVAKLCAAICVAGAEFYKLQSDKTVFDKYSIIIHDTDEDIWGCEEDYDG